MKLPSYNQILVTAALAIAAAFLWTFADRLDRPETGQAAALAPAKEAAAVPKIIVQPPQVIYVYPDKIKDKLGAPAEVKENLDKKITATARLKAEARPYTLFSTLDMATGESQIYARPDPLPWLGPGQQGALGIGYGLKDGEPMGWLHGRYDLLQAKAVHIGVTGTLFQDRSTVAGGYLEWRF